MWGTSLKSHDKFEYLIVHLNFDVMQLFLSGRVSNLKHGLLVISKLYEWQKACIINHLPLL